MANLYGPRIVTDGLVLHLDAANTKSYPGSGTTITDLSNNGRNGSMINGAAHSSASGGRINTDGTDDRIDIVYASTNFINTSFTWVLWFIGTPNNNGPMPIFGYGSGSWPRLGIRLDNNGWMFSQYGTTGTGNRDVRFNTTDANASTNWHCFAVTADYANTTITTYKNGILANTSVGWRDSTGNSGNLGLGRAGSTSWPNAVLNGSVGPFMVYNKALSAIEILQNYNATKGRFGL